MMSLFSDLFAKPEPMNVFDATAGYVEFFATQDEAIDHCRRMNAGLDSKDPRCKAVIDGPGCDNPEHPADCECCAHAVVDLDTAREILDPDDDKSTAWPPLIVTG